MGALKSPYLPGVCTIILLANICGTTAYFQQVETVKAVVNNPESRTQLFANMNLAVQTLTFLLQTFLAIRLIRWLGLSMTLCVLPVVIWSAFVAWEWQLNLVF